MLSQLHCDITFCPIVQPLVCLFMHFMDKEDCFACVDSLFTSKKHALDKNVTDYSITAKTFQDSLKKWKVRSVSVCWLNSLTVACEASVSFCNCVVTDCTAKLILYGFSYGFSYGFRCGHTIGSH